MDHQCGLMTARRNASGTGERCTQNNIELIVEVVLRLENKKGSIYSLLQDGWHKIANEKGKVMPLLKEPQKAAKSAAAEVDSDSPGLGSDWDKESEDSSKSSSQQKKAGKKHLLVKTEECCILPKVAAGTCGPTGWMK